MDTLLENFERQTTQLRDAQTAAAETTVQVSPRTGSRTPPKRVIANRG